MRFIEIAILSFATLNLYGTGAYLVVIFQGIVTPGTFIEALYFSVRTITTIGYGWEPAGVPVARPQLVMMKLLSIPLMITGASLFALTIGVFANRATHWP